MTIDLIVNSGIQYLTIPINLSEKVINKTKLLFSDNEVSENEQGKFYELQEVLYWESEDVFIDKESINKEAYSHYGELNMENINRNYVIEIEEEKIYSTNAKEALEICLGHWIPIPYFRIRSDIQEPYHHGPKHWCRMNIQEDKNEELGTTHSLVLAFDTNAEEESTDYEKLNLRDASNSGNERFKCVTQKRHAAEFYTSESLWDWMYNIFTLDKDRTRKNKNTLKHISIYYTILNLLENIEAFPEVGLLNGEADEKPIEVGLTLDIGNSRTCGLLCEKSRPFEEKLPFDFTSARKLQIRNLSKPHLIYEEPFEMQVAFSEEKFGNDAADLIDGVFIWPSLVRVGTEAIELTSYFESEDSQASISSPKRYLWDEKEVKIPWIKVASNVQLGYHNQLQIKEKAIYGISEFIKNDGRLIKDFTQEMAATDSRYSRSSIMTFSIYEILLHAVSQINSPEFRKDQGNSTYRRVLKDLIITCPTAMTVQEQYVLRKAAKDAIQLLYKSMEGIIEFGNIQIEVHPDLPSLDMEEQENNPWKIDEAMCSQLAFLYGEVIHKYSGKDRLFFDIHGKYRNNENQKSINIASIDIGGGTTDLMVANYTYDGSANIPILTPDPIFWEGFSLAGDDIVKRVIERVIIPQIHNDIESKGGQDVIAVINELFGPNIGGAAAIERIYRKQFANMIGASAVYKIFNYLNNNENSNVLSFALEDIFEEYEKPRTRLIQYINSKIINKTGLEDYDILKVKINLQKSEVNSSIEDVIGDVLKQLSYLVSFFDVDILLLSGRPSRLPIITKIITSTFNFSPHIIVNLGDYRFGNWYPFADSTGYVDDPKSTVSVGALIAYLNMNSKLPGMRFNLGNMHKIQSTAKYIGLMEYNKGLGNIKEENLIFSPTQNEGSFTFYGEPKIIGMRQLKSEDWIATPLYLFDFKDDYSKSRVSKEHEYPYTLKFNRTELKGEFIDRDDIEIYDKEGVPIDQYNFNFSLQTSNYFETHWKDSGSFITKIE